MNAVLKPRLEVAFGALPLAANPVWTDLTSRLRSASANSQLGQEGTCDLVLDNRDRALEPEYSGSPYYPNVVPNLRMRLVAGSNLLDYETSTAEGGVGAVTHWNNTATVGQFFDAVDGWGFTITSVGVARPSMITGGSGYNTVDLATATPVVAGQSYRVMGQFKPTTTARAFAGGVDWYTAAGANISLGGAGSGTEVMGQWTQLSAVVTAPATAAFAKVRWQIDNSTVPVGEVHRVRNLGFFPSTITAWEPGWSVPFDGYVDKIIPGYTFGPAGGGDAVVTVRCTDLTKILARHRLRPPYDREVLADKPVHWWPFGDDAGLMTFQDAGSAPTPGTMTRSAELGAAPVVKASSRTSLKASATTAGYATYTPSGLHTVEVVFDGIAGIDDTMLAALAIGPLTVFLWAGLEGTTPGTLVKLTYGGDTTASFSPTMPNNAPDSQMVLTLTQTNSTTFAIYMNGVFKENIAAPAGSVLGGTDARPGWLLIDNYRFSSPITFRMGHVSIYEPPLTAARIAAHAQAARTPWTGDSTGSRVVRILADVGVPSAMQNVDDGETKGLQFQVDPVEGTPALALIRTAEETEFGRTFASDGRWAFKGRRSLDGTAAVAVFGDAGDGVEIPYSGLVEDFSEDHIVRTATVTRQGGNPQTYTDPAATTADAVFGETRDGLMYGTDMEAYDAAAYLVSQGKTPALRFEAITLQGERSQAVMRQVAARKIGDKVTVRRRPPGGGAPQEKTVVIEGVTHDINLQAPTWRATYKLAPVDTVTYWTLEDNVNGLLDQTTVLAF